MNAIEGCILSVGKLVNAGFQIFLDAPLSASALLALAILIRELLCTLEGKGASKPHSENGRRSGQVKEKTASVIGGHGRPVNVERSFRRLGAPDHPHEEGIMIPSRDVVIGNAPEASSFRNENCHGKFLAMHRASYDRELDKSCNYRYGPYFKGKKRIWEARVQISFAKPPSVKDMFFGIELEGYVPMSGATKGLMATLVRTLKNVVGNQIYHSAGDDPQRVSGELEKPVFVMPLFAFDQYIVTPENETPPDLSDEIIPELGSKRVGRIREFKQELDELELKVGPTYTFCFWGISQWLDKLNWQVKMPFLSPVDFNMFCGNPPVHVVIYTLRDDEDKRHLQRRKNYYFDLAFWSSTHRPDAVKLSELMGPELFVREDENTTAFGDSRPGANGVAARGNTSQGFGGMFGCCVSR
eukprot:TRINITY_DN94365_c0_g1_i1.p1 TRINITY_DN94365_c0_g1~~TRINITY_DN94365_c0_g1_i1.p1  ORF type:complete len:413 (+),score=59.18 TRINITY_DN94365_c0_g1_i1:44-1282(+)